MPEISVVMSVYNGAEKLAKSLDSVLNQGDVDLELIVVNDGSTDQTREILGNYQDRYPQIRVLDQVNTGLTEALINGCAAATGEFIARQDVGDIYRGGKLAQQAGLLRADKNVALVTCGTRFVGPKGEFLFDEIPTAQFLNHSLSLLDVDELRGPPGHGSVMFRRRDYMTAGGYRKEFRVAQDLDLWLRLNERGDVGVVPSILFEVEVTPDSISGSQIELQRQMKRLIVESAQARRSGESEVDILAQAERLSSMKPSVTSKQAANASYFLGRLLQKNSDPACFHYFREAIRARPMHWKAWVQMLNAFLSRRAMARSGQ